MAIDPRVDIGHVHLKVCDLDRALDFYVGVLGFELQHRYGEEAAFISAGGYHHHIGLNTWDSKGGGPPPRNTTGLYHTAIRYPDRKTLADALRRVLDAGIPITGASDHGVSEAIYLRDPDDNGVELYRDRPQDEWPRAEDGSFTMYTKPFDLQALLAETRRVVTSASGVRGGSCTPRRAGATCMPSSLELLRVAEHPRDAADFAPAAPGARASRRCRSVPRGPVRPTRWTYAVSSAGGSKLITCVMLSRSSPRAATSVATSVVTLAAAEPLERALARSLRHVAVQRAGVNVRALELLDEALRAALRADEDEREIAVALELLHERVDLRGGRDRDELVLDLALLELLRQLGLERGPRSACTSRASSRTSPSSVAEKSIVCRSRGMRRGSARPAA